MDPSMDLGLLYHISNHMKAQFFCHVSLNLYKIFSQGLNQHINHYKHIINILLYQNLKPFIQNYNLYFDIKSFIWFNEKPINIQTLKYLKYHGWI
jgi:hypothetical protein